MTVPAGYRIGPRGGRYRVSNGRKVYDLPYERDRLAETPTGAALLAEARDTNFYIGASTNITEEEARFQSVATLLLLMFFIVWLFLVCTGNGWFGGLLFPLQFLYWVGSAALWLVMLPFQG
jgi:hypothetical protein